MIGCKHMLVSPTRVSYMPRRVAVHASNEKAGSNSAELALMLTVASLSAAPAYADVDDAVTTAVDSVKAAGEALKAGKAAAEGAIDAAGGVYEKLSPSVNDYVEKATPYVKGAYTEASKVLVPFANDVATKGVPIVTEGTKNFLKSSGVDVGSIEREAGVATKTVTDVSSKAQPTVNKILTFLSTSSPETLGKIAIVLVAVYYLTPFALKTAVSSFRGYAGEITPARAVDLVASDSSVAIIDIRPLKEKGAVGTPDVPSSARGRFLELEVAEIDRRLRGQLRNVDSVESQVTALEIQALKRVNKGTKILLLDKNGNGASKDVAKELANLGFANAFVISGGFQGWTASKLQVKAPVPGEKREGGLANILGTVSTRTLKAQAAKKR